MPPRRRTALTRSAAFLALQLLAVLLVAVPGLPPSWRAVSQAQITPSAPRSGAGPQAADETTASRQRELDGIRREIGELEGRLATVRRRAEGIAGDLETLEVELKLQEQRLAEARAAGDLAATRVADGEREVARLGDALAAARADLARRVGGLYRLGGQGQTYLRMMLSLQGGGDLLSGIRMLRYLARRDARSVESYTTARRELEEERQRLVEQRREVDKWVAEEEARRGELAAARQREASLLARVEGERQRLSQRADELADRERKLSRFLDLLAGRGGGDPAGTPIQQFRGVLDPPVEGRVSAGFGPRLDPRYRTRVPHNGLSLETHAGDAVHAVYAGEVLYAAPFQGYGPTVVVHHPGRVFTLYAGLAELAVEVGQQVSLGQTVGRAADELYFEVRVEKQPEDPQQWIR